MRRTDHEGQKHEEKLFSTYEEKTKSFKDIRNRGFI
jgi:hypothetical protein